MKNIKITQKGWDSFFRKLPFDLMMLCMVLGLLFAYILIVAGITTSEFQPIMQLTGTDFIVALLTNKTILLNASIPFIVVGSYFAFWKGLRPLK